MGAATLALGLPQTAIAAFARAVAAATQPLSAATLSAPAGASVINGGCGGTTTQTNVFASWSGTALLDAAGQYLTGGYTLLRSPTAGGTYVPVGSVTGAPPAPGIADVNPTGAETPQVLIGNSGGANTVHAVNAATNAGKSITTGSIGIEPNGVASTPDGASAVLAEGASHQVQVLAVSSGLVLRTVVLPSIAGTASRPDAVAITPDGLTAYVLDGANRLVYPMTISSGATGSGIPVGVQGDPGAILVTPDASRVYVANYGSHNVTAISTATNTVSATIALGSGVPIALAVTPNSAHVYVADQGNGQVADIATSTNAITSTITVGSMADANFAGGGDPNILAINPEGTKLYVAAYGARTVSDISTSSDTVAKTITLKGANANPNALALTPNGCLLYVNDYTNNQVDVIATTTDTVLANPSVGNTGDPIGMSATPDGTHVYVANFYSNSVSVIATATSAVSATLPSATSGSGPYAVLATPSPYYYKAQATHGAWRSALTTAVQYPLGWDQGGWQ